MATQPLSTNPNSTIHNLSLQENTQPEKSKTALLSWLFFYTQSPLFSELSEEAQKSSLKEKIHKIYTVKEHLEELQTTSHIILRVTLAFLLVTSSALKITIGVLLCAINPAIGALYFLIGAVYLGLGSTLFALPTIKEREKNHDLKELKEWMNSDPKHKTFVESTLQAKIAESDKILENPILPPFITRSLEGDKKLALENKEFCLWLQTKLSEEPSLQA